MGVVRVFGMIKDGVTTDGYYVGILPVNYRPSLIKMFILKTSGGYIRLQINDEGRMYLYNGEGSANWISLTGIAFRVNS
jgi:hypothetical protein